jgi:CRISPR-associated protein Cmr6
MTNLPLYQEIHALNSFHPFANKQQAHAGLLFERFYDTYKLPDYSIDKDAHGAWLKNNFQRKVGDEVMLKQASQRQKQLVRALGGELAVFQTEYHFVTGMGNPHPVENGMAWHPVWGTPYLPGAAVKGLVRAWMEEWEAGEVEEGSLEEQALRTKLFQWFGSAKKGPEETNTQAGELIFFDAIPLGPVELSTDIMTPHMGKWYEQGGKIDDIDSQPERIPADWHDPTPITFLVVKKATFLFSVALRNPAIRSCELTEVLQTLEQSLQWLGAGAKTATGYGRMGRKPIHWIILEGLPPEEQVRLIVNSWEIDNIPDKIGKDYNSTKKNLSRKYGEMAWPIAVNVLWKKYEDEISSWENSDDKNKRKAFNKLTQDKNKI